jgi:hypothetical protein
MTSIDAQKENLMLVVLLHALIITANWIYKVLSMGSDLLFRRAIR